MNSWDTNRWSNFCNPHWEMTPRDLRNIHTTGNSCRDALQCKNMVLKLPQYFYLLMEKPLGCYLQAWPPYYQVAECNQRTPILVSSWWQFRSDKAKKRISINTNHSYHQRSLPKPVSTDLTKPYSVLTNPIGKDGVWSWSIQYIYPIKHFYCDTITRRVVSKG